MMTGVGTLRIIRKENNEKEGTVQQEKMWGRGIRERQWVVIYTLIYIYIYLYWDGVCLGREEIARF